MRTLLVYAALIGGLRFTGKRQLGELSTSEFAVTILVSELASVPLQDPAIPLLGGIVPLVTLLAVEVLLSCLCRRSIRFRRLLCGNPCMVIRDGKFDPDMLRLLRLSPEDVLEGLRMAGVALVSDVRCGIIETNGQLSVLPYADKQPLTPSDLGKHPKDAGMARVLIFEGKIRRGVLRQLGKDEAWLLRTCRARGIHAPEDVFLLTLDDCGNLFVQPREVHR
ncbi:DUF421 domain-containing protein [Butyricicoccus intestinisimiae]|uniref:DUF421 domain-containing protein n=1 Tax=Butyricicoccus intestinisimiae TaxID=2841509 RepID=A0ABS6EPT5_9FIRM|nr:DUF421 domain-containing protein [Butyricicoccus intestinisimiae]MBU5489708.1 DUF421 domain-containing protein [Butyricicoccus intestinisimiae]